MKKAIRLCLAQHLRVVSTYIIARAWPNSVDAQIESVRLFSTFGETRTTAGNFSFLLPHNFAKSDLFSRFATSSYLFSFCSAVEMKAQTVLVVSFWKSGLIMLFLTMRQFYGIFDSKCFKPSEWVIGRYLGHQLLFSFWSDALHCTASAWRKVYQLSWSDL